MRTLVLTAVVVVGAIAVSFAQARQGGVAPPPAPLEIKMIKPGLYAILNRIRLLASDDVLTAADRSVTGILERYFQPNLSPDELRELMLTRPNDPLKEFSEVCRLELQTLQRRAR